MSNERLRRNLTFCGLIILACSLLVLSLGSSTAVSQVKNKPAPSTSRKRPVRRRSPVIVEPPHVSVAASNQLIRFCPFAPTSNTNPEVELSANGTVMNPEKAQFSWAVTAGRLRGQGTTVIWDLSGVKEGVYIATVEMNEGKHTVSASTTVTVAPSPNCDKPPPPCPTVSVSCPDFDFKKPIVFEAKVSGSDPEMKPTYRWTVSAGQIISGQGTSRVTVDPSGALPPIPATVSVGGADPSCTGTTASCTNTVFEPISDPLPVHITSSASLINFCPPELHSLDCSIRREVALTASAGGPDVKAKLKYSWAVSAGRGWRRGRYLHSQR